MKSELSAQLNSLTTAIFLALAVLIPLFLAPLTTDFYETPKLIVLSITVTLLLLLKGLFWVLEGKVLITRTPFDVPLLLFLLAVILSAIFSPVRNISFFGNLPRVHGSTISWIIYTLLYLLAASHLKSLGQVKSLLKTLVIVGVILSVVSILSYFGAYLPFQLAKFNAFTPTGSAFSTNALLVLLLPVLFLSSISRGRLFSPLISLIFTCLFALNLSLTGDKSVQIGAAVALIIVLYLERKSIKVERQTLITLGVPIGVFVIFSLLGLASLGKLTFFKNKANTYSGEVQLSFNDSWKISASAFRDAPFLGTGPSTYLFDFTQYKDIGYNASPFWNLRFETAFDEFLQIFAMIGGLGLIAFAALALSIVGFSWRVIIKSREDYLVTSLAIASILGIVLLLLHPSTLVMIVILLLILASLVALNRGIEKVEELTIGIKAWNPTGSNLIAGDALPGILLLVFIILVVFVYWKGTGLVLADYHHRKALDAASTQGLTTYNELVSAEQLNPGADLYRTDLAQTNFALANAIARAKGPSNSSPSGSLTDVDKQNIQTLLSQSINEGRAAVSLNPLSAQNWEILASIYRQISGVAQNALAFSLDAYGRAIQRDPLNPLLRLSVGGVYYSVKNYDLAVRFFTDAVNLKPDFANGYYNLAVALKDKGDVPTAIQATQSLISLLDKKSPDYATAINLLKNLQSQNASGSAQQAQQTQASPAPSVPPAAQETGALQQKELPKVLNLPQPENIATPEAVKK